MPEPRRLRLVRRPPGAGLPPPPDWLLGVPPGSPAPPPPPTAAELFEAETRRLARLNADPDPDPPAGFDAPADMPPAAAAFWMARRAWDLALFNDAMAPDPRAMDRLAGEYAAAQAALVGLIRACGGSRLACGKFRFELTPRGISTRQT